MKKNQIRVHPQTTSGGQNEQGTRKVEKLAAPAPIAPGGQPRSAVYVDDAFHSFTDLEVSLRKARAVIALLSTQLAEICENHLDESDLSDGCSQLANETRADLERVFTASFREYNRVRRIAEGRAA